MFSPIWRSVFHLCQLNCKSFRLAKTKNGLYYYIHVRRWDVLNIFFMKKLNIKKILLISIICIIGAYLLPYLFMLLVALFYHAVKNPQYLNGSDVELYEHTKAWELAKAVKREDINTIKKMVTADTSLKNFVDKHIGMTILAFAVYNEKYQSTETLAELGADPNLGSGNISAIHVESAFITAAGLKGTSKYLKLLLGYGGDVNSEYRQLQEFGSIRYETPLEQAAYWNNFENVKILVAAGAQINFFRDSVNYVLSTPLNMGYMRIVKYLVVDCHADVKKPISYNIKGEAQYISFYLRDLNFSRGSNDYKLKMEVIDYLKKQGIDYD
jgi:hypothetical protein